MKKFGYTLAEILIAITIIGVMTAVALPLIDNNKPDKTKAMYLKTYDSLVEILNNVSSNSQIFNPIITVGGITYDISKCPLFDTAEHIIRDNNDAEILNTNSDDDKLCSVVAASYGVVPDASCSDNAAYSDANFLTNLSFTNNYGIQFKFIVNNIDVVTGAYTTEIYVDVDGANGNNCIYNANTCQRPDRFIFLVSPTGHLIPADPMGQAYIKTRTNLRLVDYVAYISDNTIQSLPNLPDFWDTSNANGNANDNIKPRSLQ